jgi:hypothetical protein
MKRITALLSSALIASATIIAIALGTGNAASLTHDQRLDLVPAATAAVGLKDDQLATWYLDDSGVTHVGLTSYTAGQAVGLRARLGANTVITQEDLVHSAVGFADISAPVPERKLQATARPTAGPGAGSGTPGNTITPGLTPGYYAPFLDVPPYVGGDRIVRQSESKVIWCTVTSLWSGKMLTAGHCGPNGTAWEQGYFDGTVMQTTGSIGKATSVHYEANNPDVALLSGGQGFTTGLYISRDKGDVTYVKVAGAAISQVGTEVCTDGTTTGYQCGAKVTIVNGCVNQYEDLIDKTTKICGLDAAYNPNALISQPGDSGGPVITKTSNGKVIVAGNISGSGADYHTVWYSNISRIKQILGSSISVSP